MKIKFTDKAKKQYSKLPEILKDKAKKQLHFLLDNYKHPSLRARKMSGSPIYEARIDQHNRFTFEIAGDDIYVRSIGPHDAGLGKK